MVKKTGIPEQGSIFLSFFTKLIFSMSVVSFLPFMGLVDVAKFSCFTEEFVLFGTGSFWRLIWLFHSCFRAQRQYFLIKEDLFL